MLSVLFPQTALGSGKFNDLGSISSKLESSTLYHSDARLRHLFLLLDVSYGSAVPFIPAYVVIDFTFLDVRR